MRVYYTIKNISLNSLIYKFPTKIQIHKKMSFTSLFCQFLLISVVAIGTLLMIVPNVHALECYASRTKNASLGIGGRAAWELNKKFRIANGGNDENPLEVSIRFGATIMQCMKEEESFYCFTLHCAKIYGAETAKGCAWTGSKTPAEYCQDYREYCNDPKFDCRLCNTDKCNDE